MRRLRLVGPCLALFLLLSVAQAGAAKPQPSKVKQTARPIVSLAIDGSRVAYMRTDRRVGVWNVTTGATSAIRGTYPSNGRPSGIPGSGGGDVAIAGKRVAFITRFASGNSQETAERLYTAPLGGSARQIGSRSDHVTDPLCVECGDPGFSSGDWIAGVVGSGNVLAVSTWTSDDTVTSDERLSLVRLTGLRTIVTGPGAIVAESAAGGRIAVLRSTAAWPASDVGPATTAPTAGIYSSDGTLLREIALDSAREIALSGERLVVLTDTNELEVYDWTSGARVHTWPVAATPQQLAGCRHFALYGRLAVYTVGCFAGGTHTLRLLDVTSGKDVALARIRGNGGPLLAMGPRGLVYTVNDLYRVKRPHGKVVFVPMARLVAAVS